MIETIWSDELRQAIEVVKGHLAHDCSDAEALRAVLAKLIAKEA